MESKTRASLPPGPCGVHDRRHLAVRIDRPEGGRVLLALAGVDRDQLVGKPRLLKEKRDLRGVGSRVKIEADYESLLRLAGPPVST